MAVKTAKKCGKRKAHFDLVDSSDFGTSMGLNITELTGGEKKRFGHVGEDNLSFHLSSNLINRVIDGDYDQGDEVRMTTTASREGFLGDLARRREAGEFGRGSADAEQQLNDAFETAASQRQLGQVMKMMQQGFAMDIQKGSRNETFMATLANHVTNGAKGLDGKSLFGKLIAGVVLATLEPYLTSTANGFDNDQKFFQSRVQKKLKKHKLNISLDDFRVMKFFDGSNHATESKIDKMINDEKYKETVFKKLKAQQLLISKLSSFKYTVGRYPSLYEFCPKSVGEKIGLTYKDTLMMLYLTNYNTDMVKKSLKPIIQGVQNSEGKDALYLHTVSKAQAGLVALRSHPLYQYIGQSKNEILNVYEDESTINKLKGLTVDAVIGFGIGKVIKYVGKGGKAVFKRWSGNFDELRMLGSRKNGPTNILKTEYDHLRLELATARKNKYWNKYYEQVGNVAENADDLISLARKDGVRDIIHGATDSAYGNGKIFISKTAKRWEVLEEYLHYKADKAGWFKLEKKAIQKEIKTNVRLLRVRRKIGLDNVIRNVNVVSEEIAVKSYMLKHANYFKLNSATKLLLRRQIRNLRIFGRIY